MQHKTKIRADLIRKHNATSYSFNVRQIVEEHFQFGRKVHNHIVYLLVEAHDAKQTIPNSKPNSSPSSPISNAAMSLIGRFLGLVDSTLTTVVLHFPSLIQKNQYIRNDDLMFPDYLALANGRWFAGGNRSELSSHQTSKIVWYYKTT